MAKKAKKKGAKFSKRVIGPESDPRTELQIVRLSVESVGYLRRMAAMGIYGATPGEVAARFVDQGIQRFAEQEQRRPGVPFLASGRAF